MNFSFSNWMRGSFFCLLPIMSLLFAGCATPYQPGTDAKAIADVSHLHVGDDLTVTLTGLPDPIEPHEEAIKEDGTITLEYIGSIAAAGKTAGELQHDIYTAYVPRYYTSSLNVTVKNTSERVYYVSGEVNHPGDQLYREGLTVTRAIAAAGDFTDFANHSNVVLTRANGERIKVDCEDVLNGNAADPVVYPGDQIQVKRRLF